MSGARNTKFETTPAGWVTFAGYMMIIGGFFQMITGLVALIKPSIYLATKGHLLLLDYTQWGWAHFAVGLLLVLSAASLFAGRMYGRIIAIFFATISALMNFGFISAYPLWSITIIFLDLLVIYGVAMYGGMPDEHGD